MAERAASRSWAAVGGSVRSSLPAGAGLAGAGSGGGDLKSTTGWKSPNTGATDSYGFRGLPGGLRYDNGSFDLWKVQAYWWTSSEYSTLTSSALYLLYNYANAFQGNVNKKYGMAVRCVKND